MLRTNRSRISMRLVVLFAMTTLVLVPACEPPPPPPPPPTPTPGPHQGVEKAGNAFDQLMRPFVSEARRLRAERVATNPRALDHLDPTLNERRITFLMFGYGETHEPPLTERAFIGSFTLVSYHHGQGVIDLVSLTHDIRAPEIERHLRASGVSQVGPIKMDQAYRQGGFPVMREMLENATGLAIDYQIAFEEAVLATLTDRVFGGLKVDVPLTFEVNAFYLDGKKYPAGSFEAGRQLLNGTQVLQFIKTVPVEARYDPRLEHNARKHLVLKSLTQRLRSRSTDVGFWLNALSFVNGETGGGSIAYDFDVRAMLANNLGEIAASLGSAMGSKAAAGSVPEVDRAIYVVDPASGDGGVQWVRANAVTNPYTRADLEAGRYTDTAMEVPYHGNPNADDLATGYWSSVRSLVATRLARE